MNFDKIKELLKNRKVQAISALAICGIIAIGTSIFMLNNKNTKESTKVDKIVKVENKKSKEEAKKEIEDLKKVDLSKLSEEEKKAIEENIKNIENMIENDKYSEAEKEVTNIKKEVASKLNTEKKEEETTTSIDDKKEEASTNSSSSSKTTSSERSSSSSSSSSGSSEATKPSEKTSEPVKKHTHTWVDVTEEIVHAEEGHWEEVVITPEQVKEVPVYEKVERAICNGCGADITENYLEHMKTQMLAGNMACGGYHSEWREVQTGTKKEVIQAVTEKRWIIDKSAWTETKVVGRKCKECGANE